MFQTEERYFTPLCQQGISLSLIVYYVFLLFSCPGVKSLNSSIGEPKKEKNTHLLQL